MTRLLGAAALVLAAALAAAAGDKAPSPRIRVVPESFDFGRALPGKTLRKEFTIRNFGDADLVIESLSTTCGCTAALAADERVPPGGRTPLQVTLETRRYSGPLVRQVLVRSNDPATPLIEVTIRATVEGGKER